MREMRARKHKKQTEEKQGLTAKKSPKKNPEKTREEVSAAQENVSVSNDKFLYVYGITNNKDIKLDFKGLKDRPIQKFEINNDVAVLFSFYPALHPLVEEKEALLHTEILNKLASESTIIPVAFGTVFKDREILKIVMEKSYQPIRKTLELINGKIELGVKVVKKKDAPEETNRSILEELNKLSVKNVAGNKFSERLLINNSFLVKKNNFTKFSDKVGELEQKYQNLKFIYSGPWPAYSFVNINIKAG